MLEAYVRLHELGHALAARRFGIKTRDITLLPIGGLARLEKMPDKPQQEMWVAIAGPLVNVVIAAVLFVILALTNALEPVTNLTVTQGSFLERLMMVNVTLVLFNLIPAFPMDGGRVLRSILWTITGNLRRATRWASIVGQGIAWLLILAGIDIVFGGDIPFLGSGFVNGLWIAFIGWFLNSAAIQSYQQLVVHDILETVPVSRVMRVCLSCRDQMNPLRTKFRKPFWSRLNILC